MKKRLDVIELFAGVGGFRVGLEKASKNYNVVWSNQWEPSRTNQFASEIYTKRFGGKNHSNKDINEVEISEIPDANLLCGGFPCQDYSVAKTLNQATGIIGKKGVLWWNIHKILEKKEKKPEFLLLENVDRLLKSPVSQRGRDFAIMLSSLSDLGYVVEWRVINAADYGMPQRRRRVFFLGYHKKSEIYKRIISTEPLEWINQKGIFAKTFKIKKVDRNNLKSFELEGDLKNLTENFNRDSKNSPFLTAGLMIDRKIITAKVIPKYLGKMKTLGDILLSESEVTQEFFINPGSLEKWRYHKGAKKEKRFNKTHSTEYNYAEGNMVFPDSLNKPSRTIVTGEGGSGPSRFKHVVETESGKLRRLTPVELERLNMFPDNHTKEASDTQRAFLMGNALVTGVVEKIGKELISRLI